jgi:hypothetical protein
MAGLAHSRANRNARIPATAPARRSRVTSELVQWTFENGLFAGCHSKKIVRGRCEEIVSSDSVKHFAQGHEQCRSETTAVDGWSSIKFAAFLSPEDNDPPQLGWLTTSPH